MPTGFDHEYGVLQSGYWRLEIDAQAPWVVSLRTDVDGHGRYGEEMLEPGLGGQTLMETRDGLHRSRAARGAQGALADDRTITVTGIGVGDLASVDWRISLAVDAGQTVRIEVTRRLLRPVELVTDLVFGLHLVRLFALWSRPDLRLNHDPDGPHVWGTTPTATRSRARSPTNSTRCSARCGGWEQRSSAACWSARCPAPRARPRRGTTIVCRSGTVTRTPTLSPTRRSGNTPACVAGSASPEVGIRLLGRHLTLRYHGWGDRVKRVRVNGQPRDARTGATSAPRQRLRPSRASVGGRRLSAPIIFDWAMLPDGAAIELELVGGRTSD